MIVREPVLCLTLTKAVSEVVKKSACFGGRVGCQWQMAMAFFAGDTEKGKEGDKGSKNRALGHTCRYGDG